MKWTISHRADPRANALAKRHYTCQTPDSSQFMPPGRCLVLLTEDATALWGTSFPFAKYTHHEWAGAWICSIFRNENQYNRKNRSGYLSSHLITEAVAVTKWYAERVWKEPIPLLGFITFVNAPKVQSKEPGTCYKQAGWREIGFTKKDHLLTLQLLPEDMPEAALPEGMYAKRIEQASHVERPLLFQLEEAIA